MTDKYLIICGGHLSQSMQRIKAELDPNGDMFVHVFEPVPLYSDSYSGLKNVKLHQKAVWVYDGEAKLYMQPGFYSQGHSLCEKKTNVNPDDYFVVGCVDFGKWIKTNFDKDDYILVRMDIEGGEYKVLDSIINDGSIEYIDKLIVEFHHRKHILVATEEEYQSLVSRIKIPFEGFFTTKHRK